MSGPPSKKWKGTVENDEGNDSFDEDDEILDGPPPKYHELKSQHSQRVSQSLGPAAISSSNQSPPPTVTLPSQRTVTPGQAVLKTTPTSSRNRFPSSLRNSASTPTSSHGSQDTVSQGEFIAVKFQLTNAQREKDELKYKLAQLNEELTAEKKKMEVEKQKEIRRYQERLKMAEGEVHALRMSNASIIADSSLAGGDGNESVMSVSCASSQRVTTARHTHSLPQFVGGNGFRSDIVSTFTHNQSFKMDGEMSFQDVPSQAFDTPTRSEPILDSFTSPLQLKVETEDVKLQTNMDIEESLDTVPISQYILSSISTVSNCGQTEEEMHYLLEKIVRDPSELEIVEIGESHFSPVSSQEDY